MNWIRFFFTTNTHKCVCLYTGMQLFYAESLPTFLADLNRCEPTLFLSVPRLWTKFQAGIYTKLPESKLNLLLNIPLVNIYIKKKILKLLGLSKVRFAGSGSAPLPAEILVWYRRLGLELLEGYGMTGVLLSFDNFSCIHLLLLSSLPLSSLPIGSATEIPAAAIMPY